MAIIKGAISFGSNFNIGAKGPIDSRMRVETKADLTTVWTEDIPAFKGMSVVAMDTGKIWVLVDDDYSKESNWKEPSPKPVIDAKNYTTAKSLATTENIGQIVNVANEETIGEDKYTAGLYIVTGAGTVAKLGTTSASGDLSGDVEKLKGDVGTLQGNISTLQQTVTKLDGEDTVVGSVKNQIKTAKDALEEEITNVKNAHTVVSGDSGNTHVKVETSTGENGKQTVTITESDIASKTDLEELTKKVGSEASGDTTASGVFQYVDDKVKAVPEYTITKDEETGSFKLMKGSTQAGDTISFKDYMVRSGSVVKGDWVTTDDKTSFNEKEEDGESTAIKLVLNVKDPDSGDTTETIYIDATSLVDTYTVASGSSAYLAINDYVISLTDTAITNIGKVSTIESGLTALTETVKTNDSKALKEIKVNEKTINSGNTEITLSGADIKTSRAITKDDETTVESGTPVDTVLSGIYTRIKELNGSKVTSVTAADKSGVNVETTDNKAEVSLNLESPDDTTVAAGHIAIKVNGNGQLYGEMYYLGDDKEESTTTE